MSLLKSKTIIYEVKQIHTSHIAIFDPLKRSRHPKKTTSTEHNHPSSGRPRNGRPICPRPLSTLAEESIRSKGTFSISTQCRYLTSRQGSATRYTTLISFIYSACEGKPKESFLSRAAMFAQPQIEKRLPLQWRLRLDLMPLATPSRPLVPPGLSSIFFFVRHPFCFAIFHCAQSGDVNLQLQPSLQVSLRGTFIGSRKFSFPVSKCFMLAVQPDELVEFYSEN